MSVRSATPNRRLRDLLRTLGWSPARLAREVNAILGPGYVARSTVADWLTRGRVPRDPLPTITAHLLTEALGRPVRPEALWGRAVRRSDGWVRADDGLPTLGTPGATVEVAAQWTTLDGGDMERRSFLAVSGAALTIPLLNATPARALPAHMTSGPTVTPAVNDAIATTVDAVRRLDDAEGGDRSTLAHAHRQFTLVADYVRADRFADAATRTRTVNLWAQLAQTAGWMAMDANLHGLAQRYFRTALTAAHETGDQALTSHLHGCLAYQAITRGHPHDAIAFANAAVATARGTVPAVQGLAAARHAHALAGLGDVHGLRRSTDEARTHLDHPDAAATRPPWLYWLTDLNVVTGQTLITAAFAASTPDRSSAALLAEADPLITPWLGTHAEHTDDRDALLHGTWLARSYLRRDDLEQTLITATELLRYTSTVRSTQTRAILTDLDNDLAHRDDLHNHREVLRLRTDLQAATQR